MRHADGSLSRRGAADGGRRPCGCLAPEPVTLRPLDSVPIGGDELGGDARPHDARGEVHARLAEFFGMIIKMKIIDATREYFPAPYNFFG